MLFLKHRSSRVCIYLTVARLWSVVPRLFFAFMRYVAPHALRAQRSHFAFFSLPGSSRTSNVSAIAAAQAKHR